MKLTPKGNRYIISISVTADVAKQIAAIKSVSGWNASATVCKSITAVYKELVRRGVIK